MSSMPTALQKQLQHYETMSQAASRVQLGERTLRRYIAEGKLTAYRAGRSSRLKPHGADRLSSLHQLQERTGKWDTEDN